MTTKAYLNEALSFRERAEHLLKDMTLDEKIAQLAAIWVTSVLNQARQFDIEKAATRLQHGIGQITRSAAASMLPPKDVAELNNTIQRYLLEQTRLGIPVIVHEETCAGILMRYAPTYPQAIGLAATWEPELIEKMTNAIRKQMRAIGGHHALAPVVDIVRDPRWGRVEETFGEDPFLTSAIGVAYVRGLQGDDLREGVGATLKHFLGYGWSEGGLNWAPSHIPARELREVFAKPFAAAIREANAFSVMNAYHEHDGVPCGSSQELLTKLLREELGFNGLVVADYFTVNMFVEYHHIAADKAEAAKLGIEATIDIELPEVDCYGEPLRKALAAGDIDMAFIDAAVLRVLEAKFTLGLFENPYVDSGAVAEVFSAEENRQLSREIARKSLVLLKNEGDLLPLKRDLRKIAVIGPHADSARLLQGDYHYPSHLEGMFLPGVSIEAPMPQQAAMEIDWSDHLPPTVTILQGIRDLVGDSVEVVYAKGCEVKDNDAPSIAEAVQAAQGADVAIVVVGEKSGLSPLSTSGESIDRASLGLMGAQQQLVEAIYASGTPTVVVLVNGRPLSLPWIDEHIPAIVEAWLPAEEGGAAVAEVLFGEAAPGGKLPMSIPRDVGQVPVYYNRKPSGGRTNWQGDYIDMSVKPLYPFGHGLSYTTFEYSDLQITPQQCQPVDTITVRCTVRNSGARAGEEVVQLYVHDPIASVTRPVKQLAGFKRITLADGESATLTFQLDTRHLAFYDRKMRYIVEPGTIEVMIGSSSADIRLRGTFNITGEATEVEAVYSTPVKCE